MDPTPTVSVITPTLNAAAVLEACLRSVRQQDYPREALEVIVADGGSTDGTRAIAARYADWVVDNPLRTGEAGKAAGLRVATGELVALIDSDNILPDAGWLRRMVAPFAAPEIVAAEPWAFTWRREDSLLTRYFALLGMNDPLCLFLGNYDRQCAITGRWTGIPLPQEDRGDYLKVRLGPGRLPTMGANGFLMRRVLLERGLSGDYLMDIDVLPKLVREGPVHVAKVKTGIVHLYTGDWRTFARKQRRRIKDYLYFRRQGQREYDWAGQGRGGLVRFVASCITVLPLLAQAVLGYRRQPDVAWLCHPVACWVTLAVYASVSLTNLIRPAEHARRDSWQQMSTSRSTERPLPRLPS
jgi:glycosyltransferase involved in cell wall biosynthesis